MSAIKVIKPNEIFEKTMLSPGVKTFLTSLKEYGKNFAVKKELLNFSQFNKVLDFVNYSFTGKFKVSDAKIIKESNDIFINIKDELSDKYSEILKNKHQSSSVKEYFGKTIKLLSEMGGSLKTLAESKEKTLDFINNGGVAHNEVDKFYKDIGNHFEKALIVAPFIAFSSIYSGIEDKKEITDRIFKVVLLNAQKNSDYPTSKQLEVSELALMSIFVSLPCEENILKKFKSNGNEWDAKSFNELHKFVLKVKETNSELNLEEIFYLCSSELTITDLTKEKIDEKISILNTKKVAERMKLEEKNKKIEEITLKLVDVGIKKDEIIKKFNESKEKDENLLAEIITELENLNKQVEKILENDFSDEMESLKEYTEGISKSITNFIPKINETKEKLSKIKEKNTQK